MVCFVQRPTFVQPPSFSRSSLHDYCGSCFEKIVWRQLPPMPHGGYAKPEDKIKMRSM